MISPGKRVFVFSAFALLGLIGPRKAAAAPVTYLSLGDSPVFGIGAANSHADVSSGDRGYVKPFADFLAAKNGGVRPDVIHLGVRGETTVGFFQHGGGIIGPASVLRKTNDGGVIAQQMAGAANGSFPIRISRFRSFGFELRSPH